MALLPGMMDLMSVIYLSDTQKFKVVYFGEDERCEFELFEDYGKNDVRFLTHVIV